MRRVLHSVGDSSPAYLAKLPPLAPSELHWSVNSSSNRCRSDPRAHLPCNAVTTADLALPNIANSNLRGAQLRECICHLVTKQITQRDLPRYVFLAREMGFDPSNGNSSFMRL